MRVVGIMMSGVAVAIFALSLSRPRDGKVVHWLRNDNTQWGYVMTIVVIGVEFAIFAG